MVLGDCTNCSAPEEELTHPVLADEIISLHFTHTLPLHEYLHSPRFAGAIVSCGACPG